MANHEHWIDRCALTIYNARNLRWVFAVDEYVVHVKVVVPKHTGPDLAIRLRLELLLNAVYATPPSPGSTPTPVSFKRRFLFGPVVYKEKVHFLQGTPDWFLWYGPDTNNGKEIVAINLVVVTEHGQSTDGVCRTLAYKGKFFLVTLTTLADPLFSHDPYATSG